MSIVDEDTKRPDAAAAVRPPLKTIKMPIKVEGKTVRAVVKIYKANSHNSKRRSKQCPRCKRYLSMGQFNMRDVCIRCHEVVERVLSLEEGSQTGEKRLIE